MRNALNTSASSFEERLQDLIDKLDYAEQWFWRSRARYRDLFSFSSTYDQCSRPAMIATVNIVSLIQVTSM
jgi:hypothetical protein